MNSKFRRGCPGGDQIVIHVHAGGADVAGDAELHAAQRAFGIDHAQPLFFRRRLPLPPIQMMLVEPTMRRPMTALTTDAIVAKIRRLCRRIGQIEFRSDMAFQAALLAVPSLSACKFFWMLRERARKEPHRPWRDDPAANQMPYSRPVVP